MSSHLIFVLKCRLELLLTCNKTYKCMLPFSMFHIVVCISVVLIIVNFTLITKLLFKKSIKADQLYFGLFALRCRETRDEAFKF